MTIIQKGELMGDLISRQAAINALKNRWMKTVSYNGIGDDIAEECEICLKQVPSASFENHDEIKSYSKDTISREAAIEAMRRAKDKSELHRMLIQMPSAQSECEDTVSRFEVLRLIDYSSNDLNDSVDNRYFQGKVKELPPVTPKQPGWIPIGAPMNSGQHYLVTLRQKFEGEETYRVRIMRFHEGHWLYPHHFPEWINDEMEQEVVAWMPLPKPWGGDTGAH